MTRSPDPTLPTDNVWRPMNSPSEDITRVAHDVERLCANIGDEIHRASPKTQSALLEVMEEGTLSTDAHVYQMPAPFMVVATQNPIDMEGTYILPEAQLDRFLMKLTVGYPTSDAEAAILRTQK